MLLTDVVANTYHYHVGLLCALHGQYVEGLLQDVALLCERSSANNARERDLHQQRDPKKRRRTIEEMRVLLRPYIPELDALFLRVETFTDLRNKYAHAYLVTSFGQAAVQHLPHMDHADRGKTVSLDTALLELLNGIEVFRPIMVAIRQMHEAGLRMAGPDTGFRIPVNGEGLDD